MSYAVLFVAMFVFIALKAFQQRNVAFDNYWWVMPTSFAMAATEIYVIARVAQEGYSLTLVAVVGLAAGAGALAAMFIHRKYVKGK